MKINQVIKFPILTEKSSKQIDAGIYTFAVDKRTNKAEVKKVLEIIFDVKVVSVNISNVRRKPKKVGKFQGFRSGYKKAIVTLSKGDSIKLFKDQELENQTVNHKEQAKPISSEMSDVEKRAAAKIAAKIEQKIDQHEIDSSQDLDQKISKSQKNNPVIDTEADSSEKISDNSTNKVESKSSQEKT